MSDSQLLVEHFQGRADHVAVAPDGSKFHPQKIDTPIKAAWLDKEHFTGKRCYGFYLMDTESRVMCSCVDFDNKDATPDPQWRDKTEAVYYQLASCDVMSAVEVSSSGKAAHVWVFFDELIDAWAVRAWWRVISEKCGVPFVEVYPRQDKQTGKGLGNLVRFPLWNKSRFVDVEAEWGEITVEAALRGVSRLTLTDLKMQAWSLAGVKLASEVPLTATVVGNIKGVPVRVARLLDRKYSLLAKRWAGDRDGMNDDSKSALVMSIGCELVRALVPTPEIETAIRAWCEQNDYEKGLRDNWVGNTVLKAYDFVGKRTEKKSLGGTTVKDAAMCYVAALRQGPPVCYGSGIPELDHSIDGVGLGEMAVIAARPSHGKSAFAMQWVDQVAASGVPCLLVSEEMGKLEIGKRAILSISKRSTEIENYKGDDDVPKHLLDTLEGDIQGHYSSRNHVHLVESCNTIDRLEEVIDQYCGINEVKLVAIDYMQLLTSSHGSRYDSITDISRRLKQAAKRNDCAILALCQLNRDVEKRGGDNGNFRPRMSDLRESGQIEQDADLVLMLAWPFKFDSSAGKDEYKVFCEKRRNGPIRESIVTTTFNPERQSFGRVEREGNLSLDEFSEMYE